MGKGFALLHGGLLGEAVIALERAKEIAEQNGHAGQISFVSGVLENARLRLEQEKKDASAANDGKGDASKATATVDDAGAMAEAATRMAYVRSLIARSLVLLVMKGTENQPQCGFSLQAVRILRQIRLRFDTFDVSADSMYVYRTEPKRHSHM